MKYAASFLIPLLLGAPGGAQGLAPQAQPRRITMSVRDADLKDLLRAAGEGTDYNLLFDPDLDTRVKGIDLKNVTFQELLDQILPSFGFSYVLTGRTLRITKSEGTMRFYHVDWLSMRRRGSKEFSVSASGQTISTGSGSSSSSSGGGNSGSSGQDSAYTSSLSSGNGVDPWSEVQLGLSTLVFGEPVQAAQEAGGATGLTPPGSQAFSRNGRTLLIHPESGLVVVNAEPAVQARVARYLEEMRHRTGRQVLLEAKIVEVTLGNDSQIGVDWSAVLTPGAASGGSGTDVSGSFTTGTTLNPNLSATDGLFKFVVTNMRVTATLSALAREGKLQVLSSPRISTMNNQKAILRVVREEAYFLQSSQATPTGSGTGVLVTTTITPLVVPVGIVLDIQPQVADDGMITLAVNPSVSEVVSTRTFSTTGQGGGASATTSAGGGPAGPGHCGPHAERRDPRDGRHHQEQGGDGGPRRAVPAEDPHPRPPLLQEGEDQLAHGAGDLHHAHPRRGVPGREGPAGALGAAPREVRGQPRPRAERDAQAVGALKPFSRSATKATRSSAPRTRCSAIQRGSSRPSACPG